MYCVYAACVEVEIEISMDAVAMMTVKIGAVFLKILWDIFGINNIEFTEVVERYVVAVKP